MSDILLSTVCVLKINGSRSILNTELNLIDPTHCLALLTTYKNNLLVLFNIHIYLYHGKNDKSSKLLARFTI